MWDQAWEGMVEGEAVFWEGWWGAKMHWRRESGRLDLEMDGERDGRWRVGIISPMLLDDTVVIPTAKVKTLRSNMVIPASTSPGGMNLPKKKINPPPL